MNTIPGKLRKFAVDSYVSIKHVIRKRPHVIEKPTTEFKSLEADFEALDSLCYFLLGTSFDGLLDIIYENDVPQSKVNPLLMFFITIIIFVIPTLLMYVEILGAVPGKATLYSYTYSGVCEIFAFFCGWVWIGAAASRVAMMLHYFTVNILESFKNHIHLNVGIIFGGLIIYIFLPFASRKVAITVGSMGAIMRLILLFFVMATTDHNYWIHSAGPISVSELLTSTLSYFEIYYSLPIVSTMLQKATRTRMLIRKMILIMVCVVLIHSCFFVVMVGNVPYDQAPKRWVFTIIGKVRPLPYLLLFVFINYICHFSGVMATMHSACVILEQMSSDGIIFKFISTSEKSRLAFFLLNSMMIFIRGFEYSREMFVILSSIGMIMAATSLLFLRSLGEPGFYDRTSKGKDPSKRKKKKEIFMEAIVKGMLLFLLIGCTMGSFVLHKLLVESFDPYSVSFFMFMIAICFIGMALLILTAAPKFRSVHASIRCPFCPFIPVFAMFVACINMALKINLVGMGICVWIISGLSLYLLFGLKNVTVFQTSGIKDEYKNLTQRSDYGYNEFEDYRTFEILKPRLGVCKSKLAKRKRKLELLGAPPLCIRKDLKLTPKHSKQDVQDQTEDTKTAS